MTPAPPLDVRTNARAEGGASVRAARVLVALALFSIALLPLAVASCQSDTLDDMPCTDIPPGGCPLSHGLACDDPTCMAAYACNSGNVWTLDHTCPSYDAAAADSARPESDAASDATNEASRPFDASIDAPPGASGGPGCDPLEAPDCPLSLALACPMGCCGCEDLFVCKNGGWDYYATCTGP